jgi:hypothetical protein
MYASSRSASPCCSGLHCSRFRRRGAQQRFASSSGHRQLRRRSSHYFYPARCTLPLRALVIVDRATIPCPTAAPRTLASSAPWTMCGSAQHDGPSACDTLHGTHTGQARVSCRASCPEGRHRSTDPRGPRHGGARSDARRMGAGRCAAISAATPAASALGATTKNCGRDLWTGMRLSLLRAPRTQLGSRPRTSDAVSSESYAGEAHSCAAARWGDGRSAQALEHLHRPDMCAAPIGRGRGTARDPRAGSAHPPRMTDSARCA